MISRGHSILFPKSLTLVLDDLKNLTPLKYFKVKWRNLVSRKLSLQTTQNLHSSSGFHLTHAKSTFIIAVKKNPPKAIFNLDAFTVLRKLSFLGICSLASGHTKNVIKKLKIFRRPEITEKPLCLKLLPSDTYIYMYMCMWYSCIIFIKESAQYKER